MTGNGLPFSNSKQGAEIVCIFYRHVKQTGILAVSHAVVRDSGFIHMSGTVKLVIEKVCEFFVRVCEGEIGIKVPVCLLRVLIIPDPRFQFFANLLLCLLHLLIAAGVELERIAHSLNHLMYVGINIKGTFKSTACFAAVVLCGVDKVG